VGVWYVRTYHCFRIISNTIAIFKSFFISTFAEQITLEFEDIMHCSDNLKELS